MKEEECKLEGTTRHNEERGRAPVQAPKQIILCASPRPLTLREKIIRKLFVPILRFFPCTSSTGEGINTPLPKRGHDDRAGDMGHV